jgi:N-acetylglutamate synthase-like GNAT family acetyltransferase
MSEIISPGERAALESLLDSLEEADLEEASAVRPHRPAAISGDRRLWVGSKDGRIVAFGGVLCNGATASLAWGVVRNGHIGSGIGHKLLEHRIEWVKNNRPEIKSIFCDTAPKTEGFFARHGFVAYHREANYWGGELELVAMELSLDGEQRGAFRRK